MRTDADLEREERVGWLLRRPVRDPLVLPFSGVEARIPQRTHRAVVVLATVGLVVVALVAGSALAQRRSAVGKPGTATLQPRPTASVTPSAGLLSERYGLIVGSSVRSEAKERTLAALPSVPLGASVSPDGRKVAFWQAEREGGGARVLWVFDGGASTQARTLLTLPETETAITTTPSADIAWSRDGSALLIGVSSRDHVPPPPMDTVPVYTALRQVDLASGSVQEVFRIEASRALRPLAWHRTAGLIAAAEVGDGGYMGDYVLLRTGAGPSHTSLGSDLAPALGSADGRQILTVRLRPVSQVLVWPVAAPDQRVTMDAHEGERVTKALFRNSREIVTLVSDASGTQRLEVWGLDGSRRVVLAEARGLDAVRPDGSAAVTGMQVVDLESGATSTIPGVSEPQHPVTSFALR